jgi:hypothetical protein
VADSPIKKVIIKKEDLPAFDGANQAYTVRYRVVSEDKNRTSHWSPYYSVAKDSPEQVACSVQVIENSVTMVWKQPTSVIRQYDIYFKLNNGSWQYIASSASTQFSTLIDEGTTSIQVAIQLPTYPRQYFPLAAIFTSAQITL